LIMMGNLTVSITSHGSSSRSIFEIFSSLVTFFFRASRRKYV
jgi:hypothetical protein